MSYYMPWRCELDDQYVNLYGTFYQIYRSRRLNTISQSGLFILIHALTSYILEVSRGKVSEIVLEEDVLSYWYAICLLNLYVHILPEEDVLSYWYVFARIRGSTFLKLALEDSIESRSETKSVPMTAGVLFFPWWVFMKFLTWGF
jgi:hypothetical protein